MSPKRQTAQRPANADSGAAFPRLVVAGASGDSGKTLVSLAIILAARRGGHRVAPFKKGPDFIDSAWLGWASGGPGRNLDSYLMGFETVRDSFRRHGLPDGLNVIEGNRGLFDGMDAAGTHSTAALAKALDAPLVLVVNAAKVTRTAAALVLGCKVMDPDLRLAGVILNRVGGSRHESVTTRAVEAIAGVPVLGAIPRLQGEPLLPSRHLGLVPPQEHPEEGRLAKELLGSCAGTLDMEGLLAIAHGAPKLPVGPAVRALQGKAAPLNIGFVRDSAFTFYYQENLEALERGGAVLRPISPLSGERFPDDLDALYIGGGFPETHAAAISGRSDWLASLAAAARGGLPVYAECGGLMLLSRGLVCASGRYPLASLLPFDVEVLPSPQGHGYTELLVDRPNPFFPEGATLRGHEFHYSRIVPGSEVPTACAVRRGAGCLPGRDAVIAGSVWASYTHLHALATPGWAKGFLAAAQRYASGVSEPAPVLAGRERRPRPTPSGALRTGVRGACAKKPRDDGKEGSRGRGRKKEPAQETTGYDRVLPQAIF